jgi:hypothetical protein
MFSLLGEKLENVFFQKFEDSDIMVIGLDMLKFFDLLLDQNELSVEWLIRKEFTDNLKFEAT